MTFAGRTSRIERVTRESSVLVELDLDGSGETDIATGVPFFDHMLNSLGKHAGFDLTVRATGDVDVDAHHTVEDVSIVVGQALREALGDKAGIRRFGDALVPLDECLAQAAVDVSGRAYVVHRGEPDHVAGMVIGGNFPAALTRHVFEALGHNAHIALHVIVLSGRDPHHIVEAQFKAVARALRDAVALDPRTTGVPSTKGTLS